MSLFEFQCDPTSNSQHDKTVISLIRMIFACYPWMWIFNLSRFLGNGGRGGHEWVSWWVSGDSLSKNSLSGQKKNGSRDSLFGMRQTLISAYTKFLMEFIRKKHRPSINAWYFITFFLLATCMGFLENHHQAIKIKVLWEI